MANIIPTKNQIEKPFSSCIKYNFYQKIICKIIKATSTTAAQNIGRFVKGRCLSEGNSVQPLTNPTNCSTGLGLIAKLTNTVTSTQMIHDQRARYISSAIAFASAEPVIIASARGSILTHAHMPTEATVPASNPQKPPCEVVLFHNIPKITVPNNGAMKKLNNAWT